MSRRVTAIGLWALTMTAVAAPAFAEQTVWRFDNLNKIGGFAAKPTGQPKVVDGPGGKALQFDGDDSIFIAGRPLVGAKAFTIEAIFRPEGGTFQQRFLHIAETDPVTGQDALPTGTNDPNARFMFEVRVEQDQWYLDGFTQSKAGSKALIDKTKLHPVNRWYAVAQTFDGKIYRTYVDGVLQAEGELAFTPHGAGHVRAGARMNNVDYFTGSIAQARFTDRALASSALLKVGKQ
jgi:hypothetical protein